MWNKGTMSDLLNIELALPEDRLNFGINSGATGDQVKQLSTNKLY